jgi:imidazolonepropionase-like amidohydrolase
VENFMIRILWAGAAALTLAAPAAAQQAGTARASAPPMLIRNATVYTVTKGMLPNTDLLLENGKIARIGQHLTAPAGATIIDATGKSVTPGIVDPHSHSMVDAVNEGTLSVTSMTRMQDVLNPTDINIYRELAGGVTTINIFHGSANVIGGQSVLVKLKWGRPLSEMVIPNQPKSIKFALGENVTQKNSQEREQGAGRTFRYPATRMGQEEVVRDAFTRAQDYKAAWDDYNARVKKGEKNVVPPRRDLSLDPLVEVLEGKRYIHSHSYRADEMLMLMNVAKEFGVTVRTLQHGLEGYKIASEIAKNGTGLSTFADSWSYKIEAYDAIPYNVAILMRHGVLTTINSDDDGRARRLNVDAEKLMRYGGLTENEALRTITYNGAVQLGLGDRVGSLEVGKDADVAIWSGDPLSVYTTCETTIVDGEVYFDKQRDLAMREQMAKERAALEAEDRAQSRDARGASATPNGDHK